MADWFFIDGIFDNVEYLGFTAANGVSFPWIVQINAADEGKIIKDEILKDEVLFEPAPFGGKWGEVGLINGRLGPDGMPEGFDLKFQSENISFDLTCKAVVGGVKMSDEQPGFTMFEPKLKMGVGWWPLVTKAEAEGTITIKGKTKKVKGLLHMERQCASLGFGDSSGTDAPTAQSVWTWGHLWAGDYTAVWTDSAASKQFGYKHFSPFILWKGDEIVMCTYNFASQIESFIMHEPSGLPCPAVETFRGSDGITDVVAVTEPGLIVERDAETGVPWYTRQVSDVTLRIKNTKLDVTEKLEGKAIHEWGCFTEWMPWPSLNK